MHPQQPCTNSLWGHPSGSGNTKDGDWEVTFLRGGGLVPPGQPSTSAYPCMQPDGGWVPQGPPPLPPLPAQLTPDTGHLINTLALGLRLGTPRINSFSGKATPGKMEVSFKQWDHKVQCMKDHYPESVVWKSIVRSLKGAVVDMAQYMGTTASISNTL